MNRRTLKIEKLLVAVLIPFSKVGSYILVEQIRCLQMALSMNACLLQLINLLKVLLLSRRKSELKRREKSKSWA